MSTPSDDDWVETLLRQADEPVDDAGFSRRVLAALPARPAQSRVRTFVLLGFTLLACVAGFLLMPLDSFVWQALLELLSGTYSVPTLAGAMTLLLILLLGGATAVTSEA